MIASLPLSFAEPVLLLGLLSLPALWWLLRVMPPRPRRIEFPPTRLLFDIAPKEETPSRTPWWLTALRLLAAALVILAAAGPIANFILAIVIFTGLFTFYGKPSTSARVDKVEANSAAATAGFQVGDIVTSIDGSKIESFTDMQRIVGVRAGEKLTFTVKRGDTTLQLQGTPQLREVKDPFGNVHRLGVLGITRQTAAGDVVTERVDPATALWLGVKETWFVIDRTFAYIGGVFTGREAADQVGGPLRIAQISGQVATIGLAALVHLAAVLSISIGLLNLFPVPLLDGGHLLFYAVEAVRGRPLSDRAQEMGFRIGLGLVLMLMVFATYNDILHLAAS